MQVIKRQPPVGSGAGAGGFARDIAGCRAQRRGALVRLGHVPQGECINAQGMFSAVAAHKVAQAAAFHHHVKFTEQLTVPINRQMLLAGQRNFGFVEVKHAGADGHVTSI